MIIKVFVIGAHGQIGQRLIHLLAQQGHQVLAGVRNPDQITDTEDGKITPINFNLEDLPENLAPQLKGSDAIIFTAGSGGKTGADMTMLIDLDGAVKSMQAAELAGVKRFVIVSALYTGDRSKWIKSMRPYYAAKFYADEWLLHQTDLDYTIVRPGTLTNDEGTGKVDVQETEDVPGSISRDDVATVISEVITSSHASHKVFNVISGEKLIKKAINDL